LLSPNLSSILLDFIQNLIQRQCARNLTAGIACELPIYHRVPRFIGAVSRTVPFAKASLTPGNLLDRVIAQAR